MIASSRRMVEELGITHRLLEADVFAGLIELLEGNPEAAERCLRPAYEGLREHGLAIDAAQAAALLGRALLALGRAADAEAISRESEALAGDDLQAAIAWRGVRAEALARRGGTRCCRLGAAPPSIAAAPTRSRCTPTPVSRRDRAPAPRAAPGARQEMRAIELWRRRGRRCSRARAVRWARRACRAPARRSDPAHP
jgi:hypothetical protein